MTLLIGPDLLPSSLPQPGLQRLPEVLGLADGSFLMVFSQGTGPSAQLLARLHDAAGQTLGADILLATGAEQGASLAQGTDGSIRMAWAELDGAGLWSVKTCGLDTQGTPTVTQTLSTGQISQPGQPDITARPDGGFVVSWRDDLGQALQTQMNSLGQSSLPTLVDPGQVLGQQHPATISLQDGGLAQVWTRLGPSNALILRLFDEHGTELGPVAQINDNPVVANAPCQMVQLLDGDLVFLWQAATEEGTTLWLRRFNAQGQPQGPGSAITPLVAGHAQERGQITALADGGYAIAWEEMNGDYGDIVLARYGADDAPLGPPVLLHPADALAQGFVSLATLADGRLVAGWTQGTSQADLRAVLIDPRIAEISGAATISGTSHQTYLLETGASLTLAEDATLSISNQHAVQGESAQGASISVSGEIRVAASFGEFAAIRLMGQAGGNSVTIASTGSVLSGRGAAICLAGDLNIVTNAGRIDGSTAALVGGDGRDSLVNSGSIQGDIRLMGGNDAIDSRTGSVQGSVEGGAGDDLYLVGAAGMDIREQTAAGYDRVQSLKSLGLASQLERLDLLGSANLSGTGNAQANLITGNTGDNRLAGLAGADTLQGGAGLDRLMGGAGRDVLLGGAGADRFVFATKAESRVKSPDLISDFRAGQDKIDLSALIGPKLAFFGTLGFNGESAGLQLVKSKGGWMVQIDLNADGRADMALQITGSKTPITSDFIL